MEATLISVPDITNVIEMSLNTDNVPVFIGESGIGKTEQIRKYTTMKNMYLEELNCSTLFPEDFGAIRDSNGYVEFVLNKIFDIPGNSIFFIDEFSRSRGDLRNLIMALVNERKIYGRKIDNRIKFVVAMNPATDTYGDTDDPFVDLATVRRYTLFTVNAMVEDWIKWAKKNKISEQTIGFVSSNPITLMAGQACPRQWVKIDNVYKKYKLNGVNIFAKGIIGITASSYIAYLGGKKLITIKEVLNNYNKVRSKVKENKNIMMGLALSLKLDKIETKHKKNLIVFLTDLPEEIKYKTILDLIEKKGSGNNIYKWINENKELLNFMEEQSNY